MARAERRVRQDEQYIAKAKENRERVLEFRDAARRSKEACLTERKAAVQLERANNDEVSPRPLTLPAHTLIRKVHGATAHSAAAPPCVCVRGRARACGASCRWRRRRPRSSRPTGRPSPSSTGSASSAPEPLQPAPHRSQRTPCIQGTPLRSLRRVCATGLGRGRGGVGGEPPQEAPPRLRAIPQRRRAGRGGGRRRRVG